MSRELVAHHESSAFLDTIARDAFLARVIPTYIEAFRDTPLHENHDPSDVRERLLTEMNLPGSVPFLYTLEDEGQLIAFTWGYHAPLGVHLPHVLSTYFGDCSPAVQQDVADNIVKTLPEGTDESVWVNFVSEFGIQKQYRGNSSIFPHLLYEMVKGQTDRGVTYDVSWSMKQFTMYPIMLAFDAKEVQVPSESGTDSRVFLLSDFRHMRTIMEAYPGPMLERFFLQRRRELRKEGRV